MRVKDVEKVGRSFLYVVTAKGFHFQRIQQRRGFIWELVEFTLNFVCDVDSVSCHFGGIWFPVFLAPFIEDTDCSSLCVLSTFVMN